MPSNSPQPFLVDKLTEEQKNLLRLFRDIPQSLGKRDISGILQIPGISEKYKKNMIISLISNPSELTFKDVNDIFKTNLYTINNTDIIIALIDSTRVVSGDIDGILEKTNHLKAENNKISSKEKRKKIEECKKDIIEAILDSQKFESQNINAILEITVGFKFEVYKKDIIDAILDSQKCESQHVNIILEITDGFVSETRKKDIINDILKSQKCESQHINTILEITDGFVSENFTQNILRVFIITGKFETEHIDMILKITNGLESETRKKNIFQDLISSGKLQSQHIDKIIKITDGLQQEHLAAYILEEFIRSSAHLNELQLKTILKISKKFLSNEFKTQVFIACIESYILSTEYINKILQITDGFQQWDAAGFKAEVFIALVESLNLDIEQIESLITKTENLPEPFKSRVIERINYIQEFDAESDSEDHFYDSEDHSQSSTWESLTNIQNIQGRGL
jgi:hypothetical protein